MILGVNTAEKIHELVLVQDTQVLAERVWPDARDDVDRLIPSLDELLKEGGKSLKDLKQICVIAGPGSFTALRCGVSFANSFAHALNIDLYSMSTFELLKKKIGNHKDALVVLHAGGLDVALSLDQIGPLSSLLSSITHGKQSISWDLPETLEKELHSIAIEKGWSLAEVSDRLSFGQVLTQMKEADWSPLKKEKITEAIYLRPPHLSTSQGPWTGPKKS